MSKAIRVHSSCDDRGRYNEDALERAEELINELQDERVVAILGDRIEVLIVTEDA